jgi:hypothetical protein
MTTAQLKIYAIGTWNMDEELAAGLIDTYPQMKSRAKQKSTGKLPCTHPVWKKPADPNHHNRCLVGKVYNLARLPNGKSECTLADAEKLKFNTTYDVHEYKGCSFKIFKKKATGCSSRTIMLSYSIGAGRKTRLFTNKC